jgi:DNA-binding transcriptional MerR regulator
MTDAVANGHLSIGEVLALVQADFPDVTISKIRFLESQGLIAPERTASGYRKFYDGDIERLRWILAQQRDHFLPLKVIKKMLDQGVDVADPSQVQPSLFSSPDEEPLPADEPEERPPTPRSPAHPAVKSAPRGAAKVTPPPAEDAPGDTATKRHSTPADVVAALQEDPRPAKASKKARAAVDEPPEVEAPSGVSAASRSGGLGAPAEGEPMTREELCAASGISEELLADLQTYGLVAPVSLGGLPTYDAECQMVARAAARYIELGVEPRHLRMYKVAAEREAGFVEQLVMPLLKQRNPVSREQAIERTDELLALGAELHASLLRRQLGPLLGT